MFEKRSMLLHFGSNPKEELLGNFCITSSVERIEKQEFFSIAATIVKYILSVGIMRYFSATFELFHIDEDCSSWRENGFYTVALH